MTTTFQPIKMNKMGTSPSLIDLSNTEIAFSSKSDKELKKAAWLFKMMNQQWLVNNGSNLGLLALKLRIPFTEAIIKNTIFEQFCGGRTLLECQPTIDLLYNNQALSILDYGAEAKETEEELNKTMNEKIRAVEFAVQNPSVPAVVVKITGLVRFGLLEAIQNSASLSAPEKSEYRNALKRLDAVCHFAWSRNVKLFIDAEESWIQDSIDHLANLMMKRYNKEQVIVYNTFQLYRHDRLQFLMDSFEKANQEGYMLGAKIVRGAYMDKERERAKEMGYPSPIQPNKAATDDAFNTAVRFCVDHYETVASCLASHNAESVLLQAKLIDERGIQKDHPNLNFCQLLGMSDHLTFNLAESGYNVAKYLVYGAVKEVFAFLVRRAEENTSVTGDVGRELELIEQEIKRRGLSK